MGCLGSTLASFPKKDAHKQDIKAEERGKLSSSLLSSGMSLKGLTGRLCMGSAFIYNFVQRVSSLLFSKG